MKPQMISPTTGRMTINSTQSTFLPVSALLRTMLAIAQMSRSRMSSPRNPPNQTV